MVEVLEKGNPKKYTIKCCHCSSLLRFTNLDEKENFTMDGYEGQSSDWYVKCPNCGLDVPTRAITEQNSYDWRSEDIEDYVRPQFKELTQEQIDDIHARGKITPAEKVKEWEDMGLCAPGDAIGSAAWRCRKFKNCHDCLVDYAKLDEYTTFMDTLKLFKLYNNKND